MRSGKLVFGLLTGLAAGAALGILFAPNKGSVTRKKITRKGTDLADELKDKFDEFVDSFMESTEEEGNDAAGEGRHKATEARKKAHNGTHHSHN